MIVEKYKNMAKSQHGTRTRRNSRMAATANTFAMTKNSGEVPMSVDGSFAVNRGSLPATPANATNNFFS